MRKCPMADGKQTEYGQTTTAGVRSHNNNQKTIVAWNA